MKLKPNFVVAELAARQPRPLDGVLAFLDVLLRLAALIVEGHHRLGGPRQVGGDETDTGIFVGIDDYLTEINVTSPTGIQEIGRFDGVNLEARIWDAIEAKL